MERTLGIKKAETKEIFKFAVPAMLEELFTTFTSMIDSKMVSALGVEYISAVSLTFQPKFFIFAPFLALYTVLSSLVAFYFGKKDRERANSIFKMALIITVAASVFLGIVCCLLATPIMKICSGQEDTIALSVQYFRIVIGGMIFNQLLLCINAGLRGYGKTNIAFTSNAISCIVNICFNYLLIEGHFGFPALGIAGAAIATVIGTFAAMLFSMAVVLREKEFLSLLFAVKNKIKAGKEHAKEIFVIWKETAVENILMRFGFLITSAIMARTGSFNVSVYSVASQLFNINFAFGKGFMCAGVVLIGKNRGSGSVENINKYSSILVRLSIITSAILSAIIVLTAGTYIGFFSKDSDFVSLGIICCWFIAAASFFQVPKITYTGMLQGLGMMKQTKIAAVLATLVIQTAAMLLLIFVLDLSIYGVLISVVISQISWLALSFVFYKKGIRKMFYA